MNFNVAWEEVLNSTKFSHSHLLRYSEPHYSYKCRKDRAGKMLQQASYHYISLTICIWSLESCPVTTTRALWHTCTPVYTQYTYIYTHIINNNGDGEH